VRNELLMKLADNKETAGDVASALVPNFDNLAKDVRNELLDALEIDGNDALALYNKGLALLYLGKYNEAIECYDKALEIDPKYVSALRNKGLALYYLGKYNEAIECYDKVLEIDPKAADAWYARSCSKVKKGDMDDGLEDLKKAIEIDREYIKIAKEDKDFDSIRSDDRFKALVTDRVSR
jgi:tetratricopeptide (TPR) repeat protein